ncbi:MAG: hypothetical protein HY939_07580 [Gammaproteobacteria bacterium]|nr:hypothetical protein [Gammaproteobacteria bacterium]
MPSEFNVLASLLGKQMELVQRRGKLCEGLLFLRAEMARFDAHSQGGEAVATRQAAKRHERQLRETAQAIENVCVEIRMYDESHSLTRLEEALFEEAESVRGDYVYDLSLEIDFAKQYFINFIEKLNPRILQSTLIWREAVTLYEKEKIDFLAGKVQDVLSEIKLNESALKMFLKDRLSNLYKLNISDTACVLELAILLLAQLKTKPEFLERIGGEIDTDNVLKVFYACFDWAFSMSEEEVDFRVSVNKVEIKASIAVMLVASNLSESEYRQAIAWRDEVCRRVHEKMKRRVQEDELFDMYSHYLPLLPLCFEFAKSWKLLTDAEVNSWEAWLDDVFDIFWSLEKGVLRPQALGTCEEAEAPPDELAVSAFEAANVAARVVNSFKEMAEQTAVSVSTHVADQQWYDACLGAETAGVAAAAVVSAATTFTEQAKMLARLGRGMMSDEVICAVTEAVEASHCAADCAEERAIKAAVSKNTTVAALLEAGAMLAACVSDAAHAAGSDVALPSFVPSVGFFRREKRKDDEPLLLHADSTSAPASASKEEPVPLLLLDEQRRSDRESCCSRWW